MLIDVIKARILEARRQKDETTKSILQVVLGEIQLAEANGKTFTDEDVQGVVKTWVKRTHQTAESLPVGDSPARQKVTAELAVLESLLPQTASADVLEKFFTRDGSTAVSQIKEARTDGAATGVAMKLLKTAGIPADGKLVGDFVKRLRSS